ncbi:MAG: hypothetical protein AAFQ43_14030, partial [Bacteroidota bacterium]
MSDGLSVIRRAYGLDAPDASEASGAPASHSDASGDAALGAEAAVLTQSIAALGTLPRQRPGADVLAAVAARAAEASQADALGQLRSVLASGAAAPGIEASGAEAAVLAQSL